MAAALAIALALAAQAAPPSPAVSEALRAALAVPGARLAVEGCSAALPRGCTEVGAEALRPVVATGQAPVRLRGVAAGRACEATGWARVRVFAPALLASRAIAEGERLEGAAVPGEAEVSAGRRLLSELPAGATAARPIAAGSPLEAAQVRVGPRPGESVTVRLAVGEVVVEQEARALPCARGRGCALLPSGRRVEGVLDGTRILVELP
ncbi:MAG: hypothetical protein HZB56_18470 [Deltaproteobacteria bacterium]|nr:hypothetical protein [Deltaproteobacteria bacterium]